MSRGEDWWSSEQQIKHNLELINERRQPDNILVEIVEEVSPDQFIIEPVVDPGTTTVIVNGRKVTKTVGKTRPKKSKKQAKKKNPISHNRRKAKKKTKRKAGSRTPEHVIKRRVEIAASIIEAIAFIPWLAYKIITSILKGILWLFGIEVTKK